MSAPVCPSCMKASLGKVLSQPGHHLPAPNGKLMSCGDTRMWLCWWRRLPGQRKQLRRSCTCALAPVGARLLRGWSSSGVARTPSMPSSMARALIIFRAAGHHVIIFAFASFAAYMTVPANDQYFCCSRRAIQNQKYHLCSSLTMAGWYV